MIVSLDIEESSRRSPLLASSRVLVGRQRPACTNVVFTDYIPKIKTFRSQSRRESLGFPSNSGDAVASVSFLYGFFGSDMTISMRDAKVEGSTPSRSSCPFAFELPTGFFSWCLIYLCNTGIC